jgi:hypothetical protein
MISIDQYEAPNLHIHQRRSNKSWKLIIIDFCTIRVLNADFLRDCVCHKGLFVNEKNIIAKRKLFRIKATCAAVEIFSNLYAPSLECDN